MQEEEEDPYRLPISHEVAMGTAYEKAVICMDIDHTGSRLITGGAGQSPRYVPSDLDRLSD